MEQFTPHPRHSLSQVEQELAHTSAKLLDDHAGHLLGEMKALQTAARDTTAREISAPKIALPTKFDSNQIPSEQRMQAERVSTGRTDKLGATVSSDGINFAVKSPTTSGMNLLLFDKAADTSPSKIVPMVRDNGSDTWHVFIKDLPPNSLYLFQDFGDYDPKGNGSRTDSHDVLLDPYAKASTGESQRPLGYDNSNPNDPDRDLHPSQIDDIDKLSKCIAIDPSFDWQGLLRPKDPVKPGEEIIYELQLPGFTNNNPQIPQNLRGTFAAFASDQNIAYLKSLGITHVELMPVSQFAFGDIKETNPETGEPLGNIWGYDTELQQAPKAEFAADKAPGAQVREFQEMVKKLHANGIGVIQDIVFNHSSEGDQYGPTLSFKGLDNKDYYLHPDGQPQLYTNHTGVGNSFSSNSALGQQFITDTLDYWHNGMGVDGFRFDLAGEFKWDVDGKNKSVLPPADGDTKSEGWINGNVVNKIENDPGLKDALLFAEPWDTSSYALGSFGPRWSSWNDRFRDTTRRFVKSDSGQVSDLMKVVAGSPDLFGNDGRLRSTNGITFHDGFRLADLVAYNEKHNWSNGEQNNDGNNYNWSWNSGAEGPTDNQDILNLRLKQEKNFLALMFLSEGRPLLLAGDEFGQSSRGDNNYYNQQSLNNLDWSLANKNTDLLNFTKGMIQLRKENHIGLKTPQDIVWHGTQSDNPDTSDSSHFVAAEELPKGSLTDSLYSAFNSYWEPLNIQLPSGRQWYMIVNTDKPEGQDMGVKVPVPADGKFTVPPRSVVVFEAELAKPHS